MTASGCTSTAKKSWTTGASMRRRQRPTQSHSKPAKSCRSDWNISRPSRAPKSRCSGSSRARTSSMTPWPPRERADAVIFVGGISSQIEGEEGTGGNGDRTDLDLPVVQDELLEGALRHRQADHPGADERQRLIGQLGAGAPAGHCRSLVSRRRGRHGPRRCPVRRLQPVGTPAGDVLSPASTSCRRSATMP